MHTNATPAQYGAIRKMLGLWVQLSKVYGPQATFSGSPESHRMAWHMRLRRDDTSKVLLLQG